MNNIVAYRDRAYHCYVCDVRGIPETDIQLALGKCPICGETGMLEECGVTTIYAIYREHYNYKTGYTYRVKEAYYPTPEEKLRLMYR